jgi:hypothetical protein
LARARALPHESTLLLGADEKEKPGRSTPPPGP